MRRDENLYDSHEFFEQCRLDRILSEIAKEFETAFGGRREDHAPLALRHEPTHL
ncbi:MAG TPA: hypothetical protein VG937_16060 [Polyangiaceae bacterium]|nr:hypothetical protein [Polyangiaceae bacterium]